MSETVATIQSTGRPFYTRLAIGGLVTIALLMVVLGIAQLSSGDTSGVGFLIINIAIVLVVAGLIWQFGSWALVLGAVAGLLGTLLVYGPYLFSSTGSFNSVFDFGVAVVATVSAIMVFVSSIVAFVQLRRGTPRVEATPVERNAVRAVAVVVAILVVASAVVTVAAQDTVEEADRAGAEVVLMKTTEFRTTQLDAKAGETLRLVLKNDDLYIHTFTIDELGIDVTVGPRGEKALSVSSPDKPESTEGRPWGQPLKKPEGVPLNLR